MLNEPFFTNFPLSLLHWFTRSLVHFFTRSLVHFSTGVKNELSILGHSPSRLGLGDRHHRHLPRHDLAVCSGRRPLSAHGRAQSHAHAGGPAPRRLAQTTGHPLQVFPHPYRCLRHRQRRRHLVRHRPHSPRGHQHAHPQLRLRLGHGVGLLHGRTHHHRGLLLHMGPHRPQAAPQSGLGLCRRLRLHPHHHQRHSHLHAHPR